MLISLKKLYLHVNQYFGKDNMLGYVSEREFKLQFEDSFKQFFKPLCFHAMSFVKDADIAKDIVHDVFLTTWTQREKIDFTQPMLPYYLSLTRNRSLNYLDHLKVRARHEENESYKNLLYAETDYSEHEELIRQIMNRINQLPDRCGEVMRLCFIECKKYKEIAEILKNKKKISASEQRTLWGSRVVIWITMIVVLFPVIWIVMSSFSAGDSFFLSSLFPEKFSIEHYVELFRETDFGIWVFNSLKFCFIVAIIQLVLTSLAAYAFARLRFVGRKYGLMALLILQVFPNSMAVAGYYILIYKFGLVDNSFALILVLAGGSAYNIWLLKSYIDGLPVELDEAAMVDGANEFQVFYKIIIPLAMPQLAVIFLFSFIATYSEYVITSIFLQTPGKMTLALGLQSFISDQFAAHWTLFAAAAVISSLPIMIIFMCLQRFIQNGLVAGGVKG